MKRSFFSVLALSLALGCAKGEVPAPDEVARPVIPRAQPVQTAAIPVSQSAPLGQQPIPDDAASVYDLSVSLTDDRGAVRSLEAFRGRPLLVTMFYAGCTSACPLLTADLKRIERLLPEPVRSNVQVLMVSFDATRDTPPVLARLKRESEMDPVRWTLASAPDDAARELAGLLGIRYRRLDNGEFFHSSVIVLLDAEGRVSTKLDGLGSDPVPVLAALGAAGS